VPVILIPMTQLRTMHREGYFMDFFIYKFTPRLVKNKVVQNELITKELVKTNLVKHELDKNKKSILHLASGKTNE
jgi:hypothetical protein